LPVITGQIASMIYPWDAQNKLVWISVQMHIA